MAYHTTPKMVERKQMHRAKLLQVAIRLFGKQGYHATTVPRIVRESGSSTGSFYFYFRNKDDIFASALEAIGEQVATALNKPLPAHKATVFRRCAWLLKRSFCFWPNIPMRHAS